MNLKYGLVEVFFVPSAIYRRATIHNLNLIDFFFSFEIYLIITALFHILVLYQGREFPYISSGQICVPSVNKRPHNLR